jgi:hypothetical protein
MKPQREKGLCYECGKKDHMIKDCPVTKKKGKHPLPSPPDALRKSKETMPRKKTTPPLMI